MKENILRKLHFQMKADLKVKVCEENEVNIVKLGKDNRSVQLDKTTI